ncbi:MAG: hypothetical protein K940chlam3_00385 [Chlamydiae bacterium]|nr:hypothetical protein [Chlamydiota bacterium]
MLALLILMLLYQSPNERQIKFKDKFPSFLYMLGIKRVSKEGLT